MSWALNIYENKIVTSQKPGIREIYIPWKIVSLWYIYKSCDYGYKE